MLRRRRTYGFFFWGEIRIIRFDSNGKSRVKPITNTNTSGRNKILGNKAIEAHSRTVLRCCVGACMLRQPDWTKSIIIILKWRLMIQPKILDTFIVILGLILFLSFYRSSDYSSNLKLCECNFPVPLGLN